MARAFNKHSHSKHYVLSKSIAAGRPQAASDGINIYMYRQKRKLRPPFANNQFPQAQSPVFVVFQVLPAPDPHTSTLTHICNSIIQKPPFPFFASANILISRGRYTLLSIVNVLSYSSIIHFRFAQLIWPSILFFSVFILESYAFN
jgi:hypothetical protein